MIRPSGFGLMYPTPLMQELEYFNFQPYGQIWPFGSAVWLFIFVHPVFIRPSGFGRLGQTPQGYVMAAIPKSVTPGHFASPSSELQTWPSLIKVTKTKIPRVETKNFEISKFTKFGINNQQQYFEKAL